MYRRHLFICQKHVYVFYLSCVGLCVCNIIRVTLHKWTLAWQNLSGLLVLHTLVEKRDVLPVLNRLQSRFWNQEYEIRTKGPLL